VTRKNAIPADGVLAREKGSALLLLARPEPRTRALELRPRLIDARLRARELGIRGGHFRFRPR
jgi:hypothetical protein